MHPSMVTELIKSYHVEQIEKHKKLVHMRRLELNDHVQIDVDASRPVAAPAFGAFVARIAGWLGRMRPARVG